jgi:hypothetical protein
MRIVAVKSSRDTVLELPVKKERAAIEAWAAGIASNGAFCSAR